MATTYQDRLEEAIKRAGGQSELARKLTRYTGNTVSPQAIQYLADRNRRKPARGSRLTPAIAAVTGMRAEYLSDGKLPRDADAPAPPALETTMEVEGVELTKQALNVAKAFMDLPRNRRDEYQRAIEAEALGHSSVVPDSKLRHLAATGRKKRVTGTQ